MAASYAFHPEALCEYGDAAEYYLREASPQVAHRFVAAVELGCATFVTTPARWRVVEHPEIRRYVLSSFPFVIYYRWEPEKGGVTIYAVMHSSREPGYWHHRVHSAGDAMR